MYARAMRNSDAQPHNRNAWNIVVFDDDGNRVDGADALLYDRNITTELSLEQQLIMALPHHTAAVTDVHRDGQGYRIDNLRPRT